MTKLTKVRKSNCRWTGCPWTALPRLGMGWQHTRDGGGCTAQCAEGGRAATNHWNLDKFIYLLFKHLTFFLFAKKSFCKGTWLPRMEVGVLFLDVNIRVVSLPLQDMCMPGCASWVFLLGNTQKPLPISDVSFPSCLFL